MQFKTPPELVCTKLQHSEPCLQIITALDFTLYCIYLQHATCVVFSIHTCGSVLNNIYVTGFAKRGLIHAIINI